MIARACATCRHLHTDGDPTFYSSPTFCTLQPVWVEVDRDHWCGQYAPSISVINDTFMSQPEQMKLKEQTDAPEAKRRSGGRVQKKPARRTNS